MYEQNITAFSPKPLSYFSFFLAPNLSVAGNEKQRDTLGLLGNCAFIMGWMLKAKNESHSFDSLLDFHAPSIMPCPHPIAFDYWSLYSVQPSFPCRSMTKKTEAKGDRTPMESGIYDDFWKVRSKV
ncbi:hypothetical protein VNO77_10149 [Canavalia gladiata]|uniref:Uncharacterized protein n=1 Tax=Canavalia gladiata TaxID=3824 RepID=A0AAN9MDR9_CANGL